MKASFENSVSVLVRAYMSDELVHGVCSACAVGNLIAHSIGTRPRLEHPSIPRFSHHEFDDGTKTFWRYVFMTGEYGQDINASEYTGDAKVQIDATGYTWQELAKIEKAFECAEGRYGSKDAWMFNGLMAVVDVLAEIHGIDLSTKEAAIGQFKEVQLSKA